MPTVLALDLSSSRTGICANGDVSSYTPPKATLLERARATAAHVAGYALSADLIVIEAIGTRMVNTAIALATVHALVLDRIGDEREVVMVTPADLKSMAVGRGNAPKDEVMLAAAKMCPHIRNNDEGDAYFLWMIGEWLGGRAFAETAYRRKVIDKMSKARVAA